MLSSLTCELNLYIYAPDSYYGDLSSVGGYGFDLRPMQAFHCLTAVVVFIGLNTFECPLCHYSGQREERKGKRRKWKAYLAAYCKKYLNFELYPGLESSRVA